jgi:hypothetical protein
MMQFDGKHTAVCGWPLDLFDVPYFISTYLEFTEAKELLIPIQ